jgi:hypothetical protein
MASWTDNRFRSRSGFSGGSEEKEGLSMSKKIRSSWRLGVAGVVLSAFVWGGTGIEAIAATRPGVLPDQGAVARSNPEQPGQPGQGQPPIVKPGQGQPGQPGQGQPGQGQPPKKPGQPGQPGQGQPGQGQQWKQPGQPGQGQPGQGQPPKKPGQQGQWNQPGHPGGQPWKQPGQGYHQGWERIPQQGWNNPHSLPPRWWDRDDDNDNIGALVAGLAIGAVIAVIAADNNSSSGYYQEPVNLEGAQRIEVDGRTYYKCGDRYVRPFKENGRIVYRLVENPIR